MIVETYKVEAITGAGYGHKTNIILGHAVYFTLFRNGIKYDCSTSFMENFDHSFSQWNKFIHDLLSSDTI